MIRPSERYQILARLGAGGLGVVHRALDRVTGVEVALKVMPRPHGGTNLRDEFVALARLRHPNIVSVLDYGLTESGQEYFTMELVRGPALGHAALPAESPRFFALLGGVLDALSAVHARGMVHADVKPSNVLVCGDALEAEPGRAARLADFGLADAAGAAGAARGTFLYAAPEAWAGRVDARSDLYAFGVVLYELAAGVRPFDGATPHDVLLAQRRGAPIDPRTFRPELSPGLAELIVALCDPAPGARPQTADEVRDRLGELATSRGVVTQRADGGSRSTPRAVGVGGVVVGRDRELGELEAAWREAKAGRGRAVLMAGEEGIGKSRLLAELAMRVQVDGGHAVRVSAAARAGASWPGVDELVRALLTIAGDDWADAGDTTRGRALAALVPRASSPTSDAETDADGDNPITLSRVSATGWLIPTGAAPPWALAETIADLVVTAGRRRPLAILIDDAHAAPPPVVQLLEYLTRAVADAAALLVLAIRPADPARPRPGSAPLATPDEHAEATARVAAAVRNARGGTRLDLPPLDRASTFELAAAAVGAEVGYAVADALHRAAGGNLGHALRALELMVREHRLRRVHGHWIVDAGGDVPLPESARAGTLNRLAALPVQSRAILRAAAVLGGAIDRDLLAAALGHPDAAIADADADATGAVHGLDEISSSDGIPQALEHPLGDVDDAADRAARSRATGLAPIHSTRITDPPPLDAIEAALADGVAARVLAADPAAGTFHLAHPRLIQILGDELDPASRAEVVARASSALARRGALGRAVSARTLARLALAAGAPALAAAWAPRAIDDHAAAGDAPQALALTRAMIPHLAGPPLAALAERAAEIAAASGDRAAALELLTLADSQPGSSAGERVRRAIAIAALHGRSGDAAVALALLDEALAVARAARLEAAAARCHLGLATLLADRGALDRAAEHADAGLVLARVVGDREAAAELARLGATLALAAGDRRRSVALLEEALADAEAADQPRLRAQVLHGLGQSELRAGDPGRAAATLERAIAAADAAGDVSQRARALGDLGRAAFLAGDWARARRAWERARQLCERLDDRPAITPLLVDLGELYGRLGMLDDAQQTLTRAAALAEANAQPHVAALARAALGSVLADAGDLAGARARLDEARHARADSGDRQATIMVRRRLAELALRAGRTDEATSRALDALRDLKDSGLPVEEGNLYRIAAAASRGAGDHDSARWFLDKARTLTGDAPLGVALLAVEAAEQAIVQQRGEEADALLAAAERGFAELGARLELERVRARRREAGPREGRRLDLAVILAGLGETAAGADPAAAATVIVERVLEATSFERGFVLALDDDGRPRPLVRRLRRGARGFDAGDVEFSGTIVRRVAATGAAVTVHDAALDAALREQRSVVVLGLRRISCAPLRAGGRTVGVIYLDAASVGIDGVDLERAELEALAGALALLVERARIASDGARTRELMSILAHELRNPLAGILGYSEMCADPDLDASTLRELITRVHGDAGRMARLVENVLEVTRHERGNTEWSMTAVDVGTLAQEVARGYQRSCDRRNVTLALAIDGRSTALGNHDRLVQVVSNLMSNAVKFVPVGGTITIAVRREVVRAGDPTAPPPPATELRAWVPTEPGELIGDFIRLDVRDTGPGMSKEMLANLFAKFTQAAGASRARGIGLGLYISREIVRRHGGSIWVESELGQGATFSFRIPVAL